MDAFVTEWAMCESEPSGSTSSRSPSDVRSGVTELDIRRPSETETANRTEGPSGRTEPAGELRSRPRYATDRDLAPLEPRDDDRR